MLKSAFLSLALSFLFQLSNAQFTNKLLPSSTFSDSLAKVVENFQRNYRDIQGVALPPDEDRDIFASTVGLPGAKACVIYRFRSRQDTTASWQGLLYEGENFKDASKAYRNAAKHLKQTKFKVGMHKFSFDGEVASPTEELRFTSSIFRPTENTDIYKNFIAEVEMLNSIEGWIVRINLHSRKEDTERY